MMLFLGVYKFSQLKRMQAGAVNQQQMPVNKQRKLVYDQSRMGERKRIVDIYGG
jgi:hypothetical protein